MAIEPLWKIAPLATAVLGYLGGLLSDPLKRWIDNWLKQHRLNRALYAEMAFNADILIQLTVTWNNYSKRPTTSNDGKALSHQFSFDCYQEAQRDATTFAQLRTFTTFVSIYKRLLFLQDTTLPIEERLVHANHLMLDIYNRFGPRLINYQVKYLPGYDTRDD
jgi:hypothetical protein